MINIIDITNKLYNNEISIKCYLDNIFDMCKDINNHKNIIIFLQNDLLSFNNEDFIMLINVIFWIIPNNFNKNNIISVIDNDYCNYLSTIIDDYHNELNNEYSILKESYTSIELNISNIYLIINSLNKDNKIEVSTDLKGKTVYCINCGDEMDILDDVELYPYGFYLIEK